MPIKSCDSMTTALVGFDSVFPKKFDAIRLSHLVDAENSNQGIDFEMIRCVRTRTSETMTRLR